MTKLDMLMVYGTLVGQLPGFSEVNIDHGNSTTEDANYTLISLGGFPGVIEGGDKKIKGRLYEIDSKSLGRCDLIESHPNFYERRKIYVIKETGERKKAWLYMLPNFYIKQHLLQRRDIEEQEGVVLWKPIKDRLGEVA